MVDAASRAIAERGLANVRIRDIADHAGMSSGSVLYYYPELDDLLVEVHGETVDRYVEQRIEAVDAMAGPVERLSAALQTGLPTDPDDVTARLLYEMHARCEASAAHAALMTNLFDREVTLYREILEAGVAAEVFFIALSAEDLARVLVSLEDGLGLHIVSRSGSMSPSTALNVLRRSAEQLIGCTLDLSTV
jgi:AcrR family transcriptional regulator